MNNIFSLDQKIGEIVAKFPRAMEIFKQYKIDFCCGGDRLLKEAIKEQRLSGEEIVSKINEEYSKYIIEETKNVDWNREPYSRLIEHVINTHHAYLNETLPRLSELTTKILRVHGANHSELIKVHKLFHSLKMEFEQHLIKEEEIVFPLIIEYEKTGDEDILINATQKITELEEEHEGAGSILKELREITNNYEIPEDVCNSYIGTYRLLEALEDDTFRHIHLENNIMFPRLMSEAKKE
ncbi:iron-sulfur cluster repair di-iron protein [Clostridium guangxiense]|uniref:iron-sulfur cluster repair di-iron protein n=1 Tax=Clostridium guangxiense TaxID=1662055 RepID=UPI001E2C8199|nr:iron-sulfur cluster repair di-iron protein [Clostridium guangxiense]MCD2347774.1 iron-sulfur cluster repair di-iron protein [Clostridium guangxiense]